MKNISLPHIPSILTQMEFLVALLHNVETRVIERANKKQSHKKCHMLSNNSTCLPCIYTMSGHDGCFRRKCRYAHSEDKVKPRTCPREKKGIVCKCKYEPGERTCKFLHTGETISEYMLRRNILQWQRNPNIDFYDICEKYGYDTFDLDYAKVQDLYNDWLDDEHGYAKECRKDDW